MNKLLLISNSASPGEKYLEKSAADLAKHLAGNTNNVVFVPYAAVTYSYDEYEAKVNNALKEYGIQVQGLHRSTTPAATLQQATAILVGGGNTFQLLKKVREQGLIPIIRKLVAQGVPYAGWSAGANLACPTIRTTNDMPIVDPKGLDALGLVPFQINPHYLDSHPEGHGGETREQRILEYMVLNPEVYVAGLREGCRLLVDGEKIRLIGDKSLRLFKQGEPIRELNKEEDLSFLMASRKRVHSNTLDQYDAIMEQCFSLFKLKFKDYGASWRILRPASITDQILIKVNRIRSIQEKGQQLVGDDLRSDFMGIVNYGIMAIVQLEQGYDSAPNYKEDECVLWYENIRAQSRELLVCKNHDYNEAWRTMSVASITDLILQKVFRTKQIEANNGKTCVSEGIKANYLDMVIYAVFALIHMEEAK